MELVSYQFAGFVAIVLFFYYFLPRRAQNMWLLLTSYGFYLTWSPRQALLLLAVTLINFMAAQWLEPSSDEAPAFKTNRRLRLWALLTFNTGMLFIFRLGSSGTISRLLSYLARANSEALSLDFHILLPIGFSFYILQVISYLIDVYRGQLPANRSLTDFGLYLAYFLKMLSGPIERSAPFLTQLSQPRQVDNDRLAKGFSLILVGMVRKMLLAEWLARQIPENLFYSPVDYSWAIRLIGLLAYAFWLYNDFAGYTDIVRGISMLFGIELSINFKQPYFSRNFTEFWNSWHMTLSHWLRDYIFMPLSRYLLRRNRSRSKDTPLGQLKYLINITVPPIVTMLISGLWHNFGFYMIFWGALHGGFQVVERLGSLRQRTIPPDQLPIWRQLFQAVIVFLLTCLAWVAFASGSLTRAFAFWTALFTLSPPTGTTSLTWDQYFPAIALIILTLILDSLQQHHKNKLPFLSWPLMARAALLAFAAFVFFINFLWGAITVTPFVYQGF
jgi:alginate O-acetyltransferase complex protein AlgI